jgi:hypothetical protein
MHPLTQKISSIRWRLNWRRRAAAACAIVAAAIATAFVLAATDYVVRFVDPGLRIMATLVFVAAVVFAVYRWWYLPSRRQLDSLTVARRIEQRFPQLRDSLASAVEFLEQSEEDRSAGSAQLRRLVVSEAQVAVEALPLDDVIDRRPLRRAVGSLVAGVALLGVCAAWDASSVATALARLAAPLGSTEWPRQHYLAFRDVPTRLAAGQTFEVELVDTAGQLPDDVRIEYRVDDGDGSETMSEPMVRSGDAMIARRENIRHSFAFRAVGGDDRAMRWKRVEVVEPPRLESFSIVVHPPAYTGLPPTKAQRHLEVLAGSGLEVRGAANKPLSAARILVEGTEPVRATIDADEAGRPRRAFHIGPDDWLAATSGRYSVELADDDGLAGVVGRWNLRVEPDTPPVVSWRRPASDIYVTQAAVIPIEILVTDNLAIQSVKLSYRRSDQSESEGAREPTESKIELYRGPEKPTARANDDKPDSGESRLVQHAFDLAPLELFVGVELIVYAEAVDYRAGIGRTVAPRRLTIITADELERRLADHQIQIVRQLERALALQRTTREAVRQLEIQQRDTGALADADRRKLQTAELSQRRVGRSLVDATEGVPMLVQTLLEQTEMNRLTNSDVAASVERLQRDLERLAEGPLSVAERELIAARKTVEADVNPGARTLTEGEATLQSLASVGGAQEEVAATLERLIAELSGSTDYRRLARELAELRQDQLAHAEAARAEIGSETLPLQLSELTRAQRANLNKAAAVQNAIAARFEKIERAMEALARNLTDDKDDAAARLAEAVDLAGQLAIAVDMQQSARDLGENRVGQALAREEQIAAKLQQVLDLLRDQREAKPEQLAQGLRAAEQRLAALREQTELLRQRLSETENQANSATEDQLKRLTNEQAALQQEIEQLAMQLDRLQAADAGQNARSAAQRLEKSAANQNGSASQPPRPGSSADAQKAEQDLEKAAQQLANRRQQAEDDLALEFIRRFQAELGEMVNRQHQVVDGTVELDARRRPDEPLRNALAQSVAKLAAEELALAELAREHSELLFGLGAVRINLEVAKRHLADAAKLLDASDTGPTAQQAERRALARLEGMLEAFAQTASEAAPNNQAQNPQAAQPGEQPRRRPTFELLEVKMLRMLQADLNGRTRDYHQRLAGLTERASDLERTKLLRESQQLQAEQGQLAELVQDMLNRDNEEASQ